MSDNQIFEFKATGLADVIAAYARIVDSQKATADSTKRSGEAFSAEEKAVFALIRSLKDLPQAQTLTTTAIRSQIAQEEALRKSIEQTNRAYQNRRVPTGGGQSQLSPVTEQFGKDFEKIFTKSVEQGFKNAQKGNILSGIANVITAPLKAAGGAASGALGAIGFGLVQSITNPIGANLGKGLSTALESSLNTSVGSSELFGEKIGGAIGSAVSSSFAAGVSDLTKNLEDQIEAIDDRKIKRKLKEILRDLKEFPQEVGAAIQETIGTENIANEGALLRGQTRRRQQQQKPIVNQQAVEDYRAALIALAEAEQQTGEGAKEAIEAAKSAAEAARANLNQRTAINQPKAFVDIARQALGDQFNPDKLPQLVVEDARLTGKGANADYSAAKNAISVTSQLFEAIQNNALTSEQARTLREEIFHAQDFDFGSFKGVQALTQNQIARKPVIPTQEEIRALSPELAFYAPERRQIELNAKIQADRAGVEAAKQRQQAAQVEILPDIVVAPNKINNRERALTEAIADLQSVAERTGRDVSGEVERLQNFFAKVKQEILDLSASVTSQDNVSEAELKRVNDAISQRIALAEKAVAQAKNPLGVGLFNKSVAPVREAVTGNSAEIDKQLSVTSKLSDSPQKDRLVAALNKQKERNDLVAKLLEEKLQTADAENLPQAGKEFASKYLGFSRAIKKDLEAVSVILDGIKSQSAISEVKPEQTASRFPSRLTRGNRAESAATSAEQIRTAIDSVSEGVRTTGAVIVRVGTALQGPSLQLAKVLVSTLTAGAKLTGTLYRAAESAENFAADLVPIIKPLKRVGQLAAFGALTTQVPALQPAIGALSTATQAAVTPLTTSLDAQILAQVTAHLPNAFGLAEGVSGLLTGVVDTAVIGGAALLAKAGTVTIAGQTISTLSVKVATLVADTVRDALETAIVNAQPKQKPLALPTLERQLEPVEVQQPKVVEVLKQAKATAERVVNAAVDGTIDGINDAKIATQTAKARGKEKGAIEVSASAVVDTPTQQTIDPDPARTLNRKVEDAYKKQYAAFRKAVDKEDDQLIAAQAERLLTIVKESEQEVNKLIAELEKKGDTNSASFLRLTLQSIDRSKKIAQEDIAKFAPKQISESVKIAEPEVVKPTETIKSVGATAEKAKALGKVLDNAFAEQYAEFKKAIESGDARLIAASEQRLRAFIQNAKADVDKVIADLKAQKEQGNPVEKAISDLGGVKGRLTQKDNLVTRNVATFNRDQQIRGEDLSAQSLSLSDGFGAFEKGLEALDKASRRAADEISKAIAAFAEIEQKTTLGGTIQAAAKTPKVQAVAKDLAVNTAGFAASSLAAKQGSLAGLTGDIVGALSARYGINVATPFVKAYLELKKTLEFRQSTNEEKIKQIRELVGKYRLDEKKQGEELFGDIVGFGVGNLAAQLPIPVPLKGAIAASAVVPQLSKLRERIQTRTAPPDTTRGEDLTVESLSGFTSSINSRRKKLLEQLQEQIGNVLDELALKLKNQPDAVIDNAKVSRLLTRLTQQTDRLLDERSNTIDRLSEENFQELLKANELVLNRVKARQAKQPNIDNLVGQIQQKQDERVNQRSFDQALNQGLGSLSGRPLSTQPDPVFGASLVGQLKIFYGKLQADVQEGIRTRLNSLLEDARKLQPQIAASQNFFARTGDTTEAKNLGGVGNRLNSAIKESQSILVKPRVEVDQKDLNRLKELEQEIRDVYKAVSLPPPPGGGFLGSIGEVAATQGPGAGGGLLAGAVSLGAGQFAQQALGSATRQSTEAFKEFAAFDQQIRTAGVVSQASTGDIAALRKEVERLAAATSKTPQQVAAASIELTKQGFSAKNAALALDGVVKSSEASGESLETVTAKAHRDCP
jgi:hypothetical protein